MLATLVPCIVPCIEQPAILGHLLVHLEWVRHVACRTWLRDPRVCLYNYFVITLRRLRVPFSIYVKTHCCLWCMQGDTPLHLAAQEDQKHITKLLLKHVSDVNCQNNKVNLPANPASMHTCCILLNITSHSNCSGCAFPTPTSYSKRGVTSQTDIVITD